MHASSPKSWPASPPSATSTPNGATAPTRARSSARGTTPTGSRPPPTWESATTAPPQSSWRTSRRSASQYDQLKLSGIACRARRGHGLLPARPCSCPVPLSWPRCSFVVTGARVALAIARDAEGALAADATTWILSGRGNVAPSHLTRSRMQPPLGSAIVRGRAWSLGFLSEDVHGRP